MAIVQVRLGIGLVSAFWRAGLFGIVTECATLVTVRDLPVAYKRSSTPPDPKRMS